MVKTKETKKVAGAKKSTLKATSTKTTKKTSPAAKQNTVEKRAMYVKKFKSFSTKHKKPLLAISAIVIGLVFYLYWLIGAVFILWALNDFIRGETYFFENITNDKNPYLYWMVIIMWTLLGLGIIIYPPMFF